MTDLFGFINSINDKNYVFDEKLDSGSNYPQWMINHAYSQHKDSVLFANELNQIKVSNKIHYDFLFYVLTKKKRYGKWAKKQENHQDTQLIMSYFQCNRDRASEILKILAEDQIEEIRQTMERGGKG